MFLKHTKHKIECINECIRWDCTVLQINSKIREKFIRESTNTKSRRSLMCGTLIITNRDYFWKFVKVLQHKYFQLHFVGEHFKYIKECSRTCLSCKDETNRIVRRYVNNDYLHLHRSRFHVFFYPYYKKGEDDSFHVKGVVVHDGKAKQHMKARLSPNDVSSLVRDRLWRTSIIFTQIQNQFT